MNNTLDKPKNMENYNDLNSNKKFRVIFVCHGNICRSPMAEFVFRHLARAVGREDEEADLVVVMDSSNMRLIERITGDCDKVHKLLEYAVMEQGAATSGDPVKISADIPDVADPWYTGNFEQAYSDILRGCRALLYTL